MAVSPSLQMFLLLVVVAVLMKGSSAAEGIGTSWCVCKPELPVAALQRTLDYACGHGADCTPLLPGGKCHSNTDTVAVRCSYAANSYYSNAKAKGGGGGATCDFGRTAKLTSEDPSSGTCKYPSTAIAAAPASDSAVAGALLSFLAILTVCIGLLCCMAIYEETQRFKARRN